MLQGMDANLLLSLDGEQVYGEDGEPTTALEGSLALMNQLSGNRKFIFDIVYSNDAFGEGYGAELGYFSKGLLSVGYKHIDGKNNNKDQNLWTASAALRF